jgi:hypothetical protein
VGRLAKNVSVVFLGQMRRQEADSAEVDAAVGEERQYSGEPPRGARGLDPVVRRVLGEVQAFCPNTQEAAQKRRDADGRTALLRGALEPGPEPILGLTNAPQDSLVPVLDKEYKSQRPENDVHRGFDPV